MKNQWISLIWELVPLRIYRRIYGKRMGTGLVQLSIEYLSIMPVCCFYLLIY